MTEPVDDRLTPFVFENLPVRGALASVGAAHREVVSRHAYPRTLRLLLGELIAAAVLLASTLKFRGTMTAQLQSRGVLRLLVVDCSDSLDVRAMAKWEGMVADQEDLFSLTAGDPAQRRLVITIDPADSGQIYQGIVEVDAGSIASLLEHYLATSEQLPSRLWLTAGDDGAAGLLLQRLPGAHDSDDWHRCALLGDTVAASELVSLGHEQLLRRLFAEDDVRVFSARPVRFRCPCSEERVAGALRLLGRAEIESILAEQGSITVTCEFCNREYRFDPQRALSLLTLPDGGPENLTRH